MSGNVNSFLSDMRYARSEAIRRGGVVVMCRSNAPETTLSCDGNTGATTGWQTGWIIFDSQNNVLRRQGPITNMDSILDPATSPSPDYKFNFNAAGRLPGGAGRINFGGSRFPTTAQRVVCIGVGGRARIAGDGSIISCS
jgi:type IV fimbrial biogenesis protein FimT